MEGPVGQTYTTSSKSIAGYSLSHVEGDPSRGSFQDRTQLVSYIYRPESDRRDPKDPKPDLPTATRPPLDPPKPPLDRRGRELGKIIEPRLEYQLNRQDHFAFIKGYEDGWLRPNAYISRQEVAMVIYRIMDPDHRRAIESLDHDFTDLPPEAWSNKAIASLAQAGIVQGYQDGSFRPQAKISRGEIAKIIGRFADVKVLDSQFPDIIDHWAEDYINTAEDQGWLTGYEDGSFRPDQFLTRAEFVTLINKLLYRKVRPENALSGLKDFPDLKEDWYYSQMIEAINGHEYEPIRLEDESEIWTRLVNTQFPD